MRTKTGRVVVAFSIILYLVLGTSFISLGLAKEHKEKGDSRPERGLSVAFEYPEVIIGKGDDVSVDLIVKNKGRRDENVYFTISSAPPGWKAKIKTYRFSITSVHVPEGEDKTVQFFAEPENDTKPGAYVFRVDVTSEDGKLKVSHQLKITLKEGDRVIILKSFLASIRSILVRLLRRLTSMLEESTTNFSIPQLNKYRCNQNPSVPAS